ncbi:hypothetical protein ABZ835_43860 [Streptomyces sp. NPDC047461]|uniref:hypothetical protein n=1 Tax=Streptomyces sp. NPDC047461 TaxID=3155619 RepID=UPI0033EA9E86
MRNDTIGTTITGFLIAGGGYFWHEALHFLAGISRKFTDEAKVLEKEQQLRRVA